MKKKGQTPSQWPSDGFSDQVREPIDTFKKGILK